MTEKIAREDYDPTRTCQFCRKQDRKLIKYGVRHYAHPVCFVRAKGLDALGELHAWQLRTLPCMGILREKLATLDQLVALIDAAEKREAAR